MNIFRLVITIILYFFVIIVPCVILPIYKYFSKKIEDKKRALQIEENKKIVIEHINNKDYEWLLENCTTFEQNSKFNFNYSYEYNVKEAFFNAKIDYKKKIQLAYKQNLIYVKNNGVYSVFSNTDNEMIFDTIINNNEEVVLKYLIFYLFDIRRKKYSEEVINNRKRIIENLQRDIKEKMSIDEFQTILSDVILFIKELFNMNKYAGFENYDYDVFYTNDDYINKNNDNYKNTNEEYTLFSVLESPDEECYIGNHHVEYYEEDHKYYVDGEEVLSVTNLVKIVSEAKYWDDYKNISPEVLRRAANKGTKLHKEIEDYETNGIEGNSVEFHNYKRIKQLYDFECKESEQIVLYCDEDNVPMFCGRLDMVIEMDGDIGIADIKRTSSLYPEKVKFQLNLYRLAYMQSYGGNIDFLRCIRLRESVREFIEFDIDEEQTFEYINDYYPDIEDYSVDKNTTNVDINEDDIFEAIDENLYYNDLIVDDADYFHDDFLLILKDYVGEDVEPDDVDKYFDECISDLVSDNGYKLYDVNIFLPKFLKTKINYSRKKKHFVKLLTNVKLKNLEEINFIKMPRYDFLLDELEYVPDRCVDFSLWENNTEVWSEDNIIPVTLGDEANEINLTLVLLDEENDIIYRLTEDEWDELVEIRNK